MLSWCCDSVFFTHLGINRAGACVGGGGEERRRCLPRKLAQIPVNREQMLKITGLIKRATAGPPDLGQNLLAESMSGGDTPCRCRTLSGQLRASGYTAGENLVEDDLNAPGQGPLSVCYFLRFPGAVFLGTVGPSV